MKISHLTILLLCLILAGAGVKYSLDQQQVMNFLVATHGNGELVKEGGLYQLHTDLQKEVDAAAIARKAAVDASEKSRLQKNDASNKRDESASILQAKKVEAEEWNEKVEAAKARVEEKKAEYKAAMEQISADLKDQLPDVSDSDLAAYAQAVKDFVDTTTEEISAIEKKMEEITVVRDGLTSSVAGLTVDLTRIHEIQKKFADDYALNSKEYVAAAVDDQWKFVIFFADPSDGLLPGDTVPILARGGSDIIGSLKITSIKGNVVTAHYDMDNGSVTRPFQVGDTLFRKTPLGH
ncbi:MAG: hypothetical protein R3Y56_03995 [Akkermansia sp.]